MRSASCAIVSIDKSELFARFIISGDTVVSLVRLWSSTVGVDSGAAGLLFTGSVVGVGGVVVGLG